MSRFLFTCWPFTGHVYPQISIASALRARGHQVAFYTGADGRDTLANEGFEVFPFQRVRPELWHKIHAREATTRPGEETLSVGMQAFREWLVASIPDQVADLEGIARTWRPDVLVTDLAMWGPILVFWEIHGIPVALSSTMMGCMVPGPDAPPWGPGLRPPRSIWTRALARVGTLGVEVVAAGLRRDVDRMRRHYGLPPLGCSVNAFTGRLPLYLIPSLPELDYNRRDLPASVHYVGSCVWNKPTHAPVPAWLDEIPADRPWVHVTEGTAQHQDPFLLRAAARGLAGAPYQVIATTGSRRDTPGLPLDSLAANIRVESWVSHADLLPRCAVVVTTGGPATILAALEAGVPLIVVPTLWDKADNAQRVVEAGVGLRLSPRQCTPRGLRQAVDRVLADPRFRENAERMSELLRAAPGPRRAAELLERLHSPQSADLAPMVVA